MTDKPRLWRCWCCEQELPSSRRGKYIVEGYGEETKEVKVCMPCFRRIIREVPMDLDLASNFPEERE